MKTPLEQLLKLGIVEMEKSLRDCSVMRDSGSDDADGSREERPCKLGNDCYSDGGVD